MKCCGLILILFSACCLSSCGGSKPNYSLGPSFMTGGNHEFGGVYDNDGALVVGVVIIQKMGVGLQWSGSGPNLSELRLRATFDKLPNKSIDLLIKKDVNGTSIKNVNVPDSHLEVGSVLIVDGQLDILKRVNIKDYKNKDELISAVTSLSSQ